MYKVTDEQIDFILDNIKANGVTIEDLQYNLLDHICCIVENEMAEDEDFYKFYGTIMPRFFKNELKEIEQETNNLLTFKNYYAMKNTLKISGIISSILTIFGAVFKVMHWPGAGMLIVLGGLSFSLIFLPLMIVLKFKDEESKISKWVFSFGFLLAMGAGTGTIFKLMHWPYANFLMLWSVTLFVFAYVPLYYITQIRKAEKKFNATINAVLMMACGGMLFAMFNLRPSSALQESVSASYTFMNNNASELVNENATLITSVKDREEAIQFHETSKKLFEDIEAIKLFLISKAEDVSLEGAKKMTLLDMQRANDGNINRKNFDDAKGEHSFESLSKAIEGYNNKVKAMFPTQADKLIAVDELQLTNTILSVLLHELSQIQLQIATTENSYLSAVSAKQTI
ncbi:MAG: hypothetical protein KDD24_09460 [Flavobacteriales bacterium]|nr:hypothetical protein [Flavobacteriales bacterium]MCB9174721.1 hypothetical protein [Flavobacteriales bacterium]